MKKKIIFVLVIIVIIIGFIGVNNFYNRKITYKECKNNEVKLKYITHKFTGESEHFGFETGNVDLDKNNYEILLTNFRQTKKVKNIDDFKITIYFNDKEWSSNEWNKNKDISFRKFLKNIIVYEEDTEYIEENSPNFRRSSDAFIETSPDEFKSAIKVVAKYCYKNKCNTENMKIKFID